MKMRKADGTELEGTPEEMVRYAALSNGQAPEKPQTARQTRLDEPKPHKTKAGYKCDKGFWGRVYGSREGREETKRFVDSRLSAGMGYKDATILARSLLQSANMRKTKRAVARIAHRIMWERHSKFGRKNGD